MKGLELPINVLVLIAVAVIVLLGIVALYFTGFLGPAGTISFSEATSTACASWQRQNYPDPFSIGITNFDANRDSTIGTTEAATAACSCGTDPAGGDTLGTLAECRYSDSDCTTAVGTADIRNRICGFP